MSDRTIAVVSVSGGKDSTATALLALDAMGDDGVRFVFADTGNEHELTLQHVHEYMPKAFGLPVEVVRADFAKDIARKRIYIAEKWPGKGVPAEFVERALAVLHPTSVPFLDLCLWKGRFPSRMAQFCTQELKRYPLDAYMIDRMLDGLAVQSWQGVRRDESQSRRNVLDREKTPEGWEIVRPIAAWSALEVVAFVRSRGIELNPLYSQGMTRVGCMPCINANKGELAEIAKRFPEHVDRIREWERLVGEASKRGLATFFAGHDEGLGLTNQQYHDRNTIDQKIAWARTSHGGKQYTLDSLEPPSSCSSIYGLCE